MIAGLDGLRDLSRAFLHFARGRIAVAGALMVAGAALEGFSLVLIVPLVALMLGHRGGPAVPVHFGSPDMLLMLVLAIFVLAMALRAAILAARDRMLNDLQIGFVDQQRLGIVAALAASRWQDIVALRHARITHALGSEIARTATALHLALAVVASGVMLIAQSLVVAVLSPGLALIALALLAFATAASLPMLRRAGVLGQALTGGNLTLLDTVGQLMAGLKPALAQNLQAAFVAEFGYTLADLGGRQRAFVAKQARGRILATTGAAIALALAVLAARGLALPVPRLIASLAIFSRMFGPAMTILRSAQQIAGVLPSSTALMALRRELDAGAAITEAGGAAIANGPIRLTGVSYRHSDTAGLHDLTLTIAAGEIVGVCGISGAGKTSFVDLLCGLIVPDSGSVQIGNVVLDAGRLAGWRARIAYVAQDTYVFHGTVRRNLSWGLPDVCDTELWRALDLVELSARVQQMAGTLDAVVGERGTALSGGERQRLALAHAVLRSPALLILDEATNALDFATEQRLLRRIAGLDEACTIVLVSHRPEALRTCQRLLTFEDGKLTADERSA